MNRNSVYVNWALTFAAAAVCLAPFPAVAAADDAAYCRKMQARAESEAAVLLWPTVSGQALRFQPRDALDPTVGGSDDWQYRGALELSPIDIYKGLNVLRIGDADCGLHEATVMAQELLAQGSDYGRLSALRRQSEFLEAKRAGVEALRAKAQEQYRAKLITLVDLDDVRARAGELERKTLQVRGEVERLEARGLAPSSLSLADLAERIRDRSAAYEREASSLRAISPWTMSVGGGVTTQARSSPPAYFALLQVGLSLGAFARGASETRYQEARSEEVAKAGYELPQQLHVFREDAAKRAATAARELASLGEELRFLDEAAQALRHADVPAASKVAMSLELRTTSLQSDEIYLRALLGELARLNEEAHAS
jgi:hypothetical protein